MKINKEILKSIKENNNLITTKQFVELGFSKSLLTKYVKSNVLERSQRGVYILADTIQDDLYLIMLNSEKIVFSHDTALFLNGISDRTPFIHTITVPSYTQIPKNIASECECFYIKIDLYEIGLTEKQTTFGNTVRCYDAERTICDLLRSRNRCDEETVVSAIKNYVKYEKKDFNKLMQYAEVFKVKNDLKKYMEVLTWVLNQWALKLK